MFDCVCVCACFLRAKYVFPLFFFFSLFCLCASQADETGGKLYLAQAGWLVS